MEINLLTKQIYERKMSETKKITGTKENVYVCVCMYVCMHQLKSVIIEIC